MRASIFRSRPGQVLTVGGTFLVLWWSLAGQDPASWWIGVPLSGLATVVALHGATGRRRLSVLALLRFVPFFLWRSFAGAVDVARRAFDPRLPLDPAFLEFRIRLSDETALVLVTSVLNLHPGTLTAAIDGNHLTLHVVDRTQPIEAQVRAVEAAVARLLDLPLSPETAT